MAVRRSSAASAEGLAGGAFLTPRAGIPFNKSLRGI